MTRTFDVFAWCEHQLSSYSDIAILEHVRHLIDDLFEKRKKDETLGSSGKKHAMTPPPIPAKDDLVSRLDTLSLDDHKGPSPKADFVGGFKHGPANPDSGRGASSRTTPPAFPTPINQTPPPPPGPLPRPPQMVFPTPVHYQPSRTMQYALSDNPSDPVWLELESPIPPPRSHSDEPRMKNDMTTSPARLEVSTPKRPRAVSSPPMSPTTSKDSSSPGKIGDERTQCCGITKKGVRCTRQVKADPPLNIVDPDLPTERFCFQHKKEVNEQTGYYSRSKKEWVDFCNYIPDYLHPDTQAALRVEMERSPTQSDEPGYIYTFEIRDPNTPFMIHLKVGRTVELNTRLNNWKKQCGSKEQVLRGWWPGTVANDDSETSLMKGRVQPGEKGAFCHKLERLVHLELADLVVHAPYLHKDFPNAPAPDSLSTKVSRSNPGTPGKAGRRAGASSSALNSLQQGGRPCRDCGAVHREIFSFIRPEKGPYKGQEWDRLVMPVIEKWGRFVKEYA